MIWYDMIWYDMYNTALSCKLPICTLYDIIIWAYLFTHMTLLSYNQDVPSQSNKGETMDVLKIVHIPH